MMKLNLCLPHESIYKDKEVEQVKLEVRATSSSLDIYRYAGPILPGTLAL